MFLNSFFFCRDVPEHLNITLIRITFQRKQQGFFFEVLFLYVYPLISETNNSTNQLQLFFLTVKNMIMIRIHSGCSEVYVYICTNIRQYMMSLIDLWCDKSKRRGLPQVEIKASFSQGINTSKSCPTSALETSILSQSPSGHLKIETKSDKIIPLQTNTITIKFLCSNQRSSRIVCYSVHNYSFHA